MAKRIVSLEVEPDGTGGYSLVGIRCDNSETDPVPLPGTVMLGAIVPVIIAPASLPAHLLPCDGSEYLREDYPALYALLDSAFIVDGDHFVTPDLRGITVIGAGLYNPGAINYTVNSLTGARRHTLTEAEMPSHTHTQNAHTHLQDSHNHTQNAHTHVQNSHGHVGNAHSHEVVDPGHVHSMSHSHSIQARANSAAGANNELMRSNSTGTDNDWQTGLPSSSSVNSALSGISVGNSVISVQDATATNQNTTAVNNAATAVNQSTTAVNQNTGDGQPHNNMQPSRALNYALVAR